MLEALEILDQWCRKRFCYISHLVYLSNESKLEIRHHHQFFRVMLECRVPPNVMECSSRVFYRVGLPVFPLCSSGGVLKMGEWSFFLSWFYGFSILNHPAIGTIGVPPWQLCSGVHNGSSSKTCWWRCRMIWKCVFQKGFPTSIHCSDVGHLLYPGYPWISLLYVDIALSLSLIVFLLEFPCRLKSENPP